MWTKKTLTKRTKIMFSFLFVLSYCALFPVSPISVLAAPNTGDLGGVDFFILIDQTNSMKINDPQNLRISTAQYFLDYAAFYAISHPNSITQVSVINFGANSEVTPLSPFPLTQTIAESVLLKELKGNLVASYLGEADLISAFSLIDSELKGSGYRGENRQRIILIITDGNPVSSSQNETDIRSDFSKLGGEINSLKEEFNGRQDLFTVAIYPQAEYWSNIVGPYWQSVSTSAVRIQQMQDFKFEITKHINPILGYDGRIYSAGEDILTDPYQRDVEFLIQKYSPSDEVTIEYDNGSGVQELEPDNQNITRYQSDNFEQLIIKNPSVSRWRFSSSSNGRLEILKASNPILIDQVFPQKRIALNIPFYFQFSAIDYKIAVNKDYPLVWDVSLVEPDGILQRINIVNDGSFFRSDKTYIPTKFGDYRLTATLFYTASNLNEPKLIYSGGATFSSFEPEFSLEPSSPYLQYGPIQNLTLLIKDQDGDNVQIDPSANLNYYLRLRTSSNEINTYLFEKTSEGYIINEPIFLDGNGNNSFVVIVADENQKNLIEKPFDAEIFSNIGLKTPPSKIAQYSTNTSIELIFLNPDGSRYIPLSSADLKINLTIIPASEKSPVTTVMKFDEQNNSFIAHFPGGIPSSILGETLVRVTGVYTFDGKEFTIFEKDLNYSVVSDLPNFRVISPLPSEDGYPLFRGLKKVGIPVQIQWVNNGLPVDPKTIFTNDPADLISVDIIKDGKTYLSEIKLSQISNSDPSIWGTNVTDLNSSGEYEVVFHLNNAILLSKQPYELESSIISVRLFEDAWQRIIKFGGMSFLVLIIGIWGIKEIIERREPYPRGRLSVVEHNINSSKDIAVIQLTGKRRRTVKIKIVDANLLKLGIAYLVIRHAAGQRGAQADGIEVKGMSKKGERVFSLQFDREQEKRIPRGDQLQVYYELSYKPYESHASSDFTN